MAFPEDLEVDRRFRGLVEDDPFFDQLVSPEPHVNAIALQGGLGYPVNPRGCCFGYAVVGMISAMRHDTANFEKDMAIIARMRSKAEDIDWYKEFLKLKPWSESSKKAQENLKFALSRLEQLHVVHDPAEHRGIFDAFYDSKGPEIKYQGSSIRESAALYAPKNMEAGQEIVVTNRACSLYSKDEFEHSMRLFHSVCRDSKEPIALILGTEAHSVSCTYDPIAQEWIVAEFYAPPPKHIKDFETLISELWAGITRYDIVPVAVVTQVLTNQINQENLKQSISSWQAYQEQLVKTERLAQEISDTQDNLLLLASRENYPAVVEAVLDVLYTEGGMESVLAQAFYMASQNGNIEILELLMKKGAKINLAIEGIPIIFGALGASQAIAIDWLIQHHVNPNVENRDGLTPLFIAANRNDTNIMRALIAAGADLEYKNTYEVTALYMAVLNRDHITVLNLLKNGANPNCVDKTKNSALSMAAGSGDEMLVNMLLAYGADPKIKDSKNSTVLFFAPKTSPFRIMEMLLKAGTNINAVNDQGKTLLYWAVENGNEELVEFLLSHGADPNIGNPVNNKTPLIQAVEENKLSIANILMMNGADCTPQYKKYTALDIAVDRLCDDMVEILLSYGASHTQRLMLSERQINSMLLNALDRNHYHTIRWLAGLGADIDRKNEKGETFLMVAIEHQDLHLTRLLCALFADVNITTPEGKSALYCAASRGNLEMVELVFSPAVMDKQLERSGYSPLLIAAKWGHADVVRFLLENGADPNLKDRQNRTALDLAKEYEKPAVQKILEEFKPKEQSGMRNA